MTNKALNDGAKATGAVMAEWANKPITLFGVEYPSRKAAAGSLSERFSISRRTVLSHIHASAGREEIEAKILRASRIVSGEISKWPVGSPITLFGVEYPSRKAAAGSLSERFSISRKIVLHHIHASAGREEIEAKILRASRIVSGETGRDWGTEKRPIKLFGVDYPSMAEASRDLSGRFQLLPKAIERLVNGRESSEEAERSILRYTERREARRITLFDTTYRSATAAAKDLSRRSGVLEGAIYAAIKAGGRVEAEIERLIESRKRRAELLRVNGRQYKSLTEFALESGLSEHTVRAHVGAGNSLKFVAGLYGVASGAAKGEGRRPTKVTRNSVRMSGWVWAGAVALATYLKRGTRPGNTRAFTELAAEKGWAFAVQELLVENYTFGNLLANNRLRPELEAELPEWCLPIDQPRLGPIDAQDARGTPDWAVMPPGAVHEFYAAREVPNIVKTARAMLEQSEA